MKRILIPLDGSQRSLFALDEVRSSFSPKAFEVILLMISETPAYVNTADENAATHAALDGKLDELAGRLPEFSVIKRSAIGKAGEKIVECAKELGAVMIVMTRSTKSNLSNAIGTTAAYVIRHASCNVMIVRESGHDSIDAYRGIICRKATGTVTLRGQLSQKQSECMLPCVKGDTIYRVSVTRGRIRFTHRSYNVSTRAWDIVPLNGQPALYDIGEGETVDIPINAENETGKLDRIRIINRNMKTEAVFAYTIMRAKQ